MSSSESSTAYAASPSGTKLSQEATRAIRPENPLSISAVITPSETPPVRRVSSAISTRPVSSADSSRSSTGSGESQRRSSTRQPTPSAASRAATRRLIRTPLAKVTMVRSRPSPYVRARPIGTWVSAQRSGGAYGASQPPSPSSSRSRVW